jgi:hypothetical protein
MPEFQRFREVMQKIITVPKVELDRLVQEAKAASSRKGNPHAPERKAAKRKR